MISQQKYIIDTPISTATATRLDMDEPGSPINETMYRGIIGSLMYLTASRPDIIFSVGLCAKFQSNPKESHLKAAKRILRKSTSSMTHFLGSCLISWGTRKQNSVALSTAEAKYVAVVSCCAQLLTEDQIANIFTKALSGEHFERNRLALGLIKPS
ncbi:secreted RxLR effector protein 161-like [Nicotiana tabacum]|uniref:Secreted RxLR effector protein 161-like n=1 Tax=Nicotiana tabacum TaxID=4097 RepID=A0AC58T484_TOBAC